MKKNCPLTPPVFLFLIGLLIFNSSCQRKRDISILPGIYHGVVYIKFIDDPILKPEPRELPIKMEFQVNGNQVVGSFINGDEKVTSTSGSFDGYTVKLRFDYYDADFEATIVRRELIGKITRTWHQKKMVRDLKIWKGGEPMIVPAAAEGKDVSGEWEMRVGEGDKQKSWRLILNQKNAILNGTIISTGGDWGTMTGSIGYGKIILSRFDVINAHMLTAMLNDKGELTGLVDIGQGEPPRKIFATRVGASNDSITNPGNNTRLKNPAEPLVFSGVNFDGATIDQSNPRFKNKVVVIEITGTWCPNCYDEAPLLNDYYQRYKDQGLEVIGLSFEYTGDQKRDLEQIKIFAKKHDIDYLMLLGGSTENDDIAKKLPQLENFGAYPTTIFIGRDGLVKKIHAGFEGPATGEKFTRLKSEFEETIKELLKGE